MLQVQGEAPVAELPPPVDTPEAEQESRFRKAARGCLKGLGLAGSGLLAGAVGTAVFPTEVEIGPHKAEVTLTFDSAATFDTGILGSGIRPLDNTFGIGAYVDVKGVPIPIGDNAQPLDFTAEELMDYASLYTNAEEDIADARNEVAKRFGLYALGGLAFTTLAWRNKYGRQAREDLIEFSRGKTGKAAAAAGLVFAGACAIQPPSLPDATENAQPVSSAFDGTPLEGFYVRGRYLQTLVNNYGPQLMDYWQENDTFWSHTRDNLEREFSERAILQADDEHDLVLFYTDLHCNPGMGDVIERISNATKPDVIASGGDNVWSGTEYEEPCVSIIEDAWEGAEEVVAPGNHDSSHTADDLAERGYTVLQGEVEEIGGLRVLGDRDPRRSELMQDMRPIGEQSVERLNQELAETACDDPEGVDLLLIHEPDAALETAARGCVDMILSGHMHHETITTATGENGEHVWHLNGGSAGGAEGMTIGPLEQPAVVYLISVDKETGKPDMYQRITVSPDSSVNVDFMQHVPQN